MTEILNLRAQQILKILVERYIREGSPVGSKTLADEYALGLSSATIRNILADLEENGYLCSPHPSAGRIPTEQGYRVFVDSLLTIKPLEEIEVQEELKSQLHPDLNMSNLLQSASNVLSELTNMIGIVTLPRRNRAELRQLEFLALSGNRVLVILVLNNREVQNRIIYTDKIYTPSELQVVSNYINTHYAGKDLLSSRTELLNALRDEQDYMLKLIQAALDIAHKALNPDDGSGGYVIAGQASLFNLPSYAKEINVEQIRSLFEAFSQKQEVLTLLNQALEAEGVQIFIGKEAGYEVFDHCSIVATSYASDAQLMGSLGVIGPARMPYDRVISAVDVTAKLLSAALNYG